VGSIKNPATSLCSVFILEVNDINIKLAALKFYDYSSFIRGYAKATIRRYRFVINYYCKYCQITEFEQINEENIRKLFFYGRTEFDSPEVDNEVIIDAKTNYARVGDFVEVTINDATEYDLYGVTEKAWVGNSA